MTYLFLDPGGDTGWAEFAVSGQFLDMGYVNCRKPNLTNITELLNDKLPSHIICEDFYLRPNMAKVLIWNSLDTLRLIGMVQGWAYALQNDFKLQQPASKTMGYKYWGKSSTSKI
jgi:hypothetical protein